MTTTQCSVRFFLGDPNALRSTTIYLYFRYYKWTGDEKKRCTVKLPTPYTVHPKDWNKKEDKLKPGRPGESKINASLMKIHSDIKTLWADLTINQESISVEEIHKAVSNAVQGIKVKDTKSDFNAAFETFCNYLKHTEKRSPLTINKYHNLKRLLDFFSNNSGQSLTFENIDIQFYHSFQAYLYDGEHDVEGTGKKHRPKVKMKKNTVGKMLKMLKRFLKYCHICDITEAVHYMKFKSFSEEVEKIALTFDDLKALHKVDLKDAYILQDVRDVFLFACYTGQRYSDVAGLRWDDIEGKFWKLTEQKTGDKRTVILLPPALEIIKKHSKEMLPLPVKSNAQTNALLKELGEKAGLNKAVKITEMIEGKKKPKTYKKFELISFHTARRTFITLSEEMGLRRDIAKAMTGHKDDRTYQKYNKITVETIAEELYNAWDKKSMRIA
jgi:integrase